MSAAVDVVHVLVERVDDRALGVGLHGDQLDVDLFCQLLQPPVDLIERRRAVDLRFAPAEEIEVRPVHDENLQPRLRCCLRGHVTR